ncbi:MAG: tRNA (cytidine(34)-2'-O)-methyltransferase [bacterium]|nr:tRNA (cytidine(34)-2'-O)-methyltransferase [bacterium]
MHVALVAPEIHWNTGNIGRTCLATGASLHLIRPLGFSLDDRYLKRAGLDYWRHVEPRIWPGWQAFEANLPELGEPFFFSAEADRDLWSVRFPPGAVLIFGSETSGLPAEIRQHHADRLLAIPMVDGPVRSLNLSTSAAIAIYEARRQLREGER